MKKQVKKWITWRKHGKVYLQHQLNDPLIGKKTIISNIEEVIDLELKIECEPLQYETNQSARKERENQRSFPNIVASRVVKWIYHTM